MIWYLNKGARGKVATTEKRIDGANNSSSKALRRCIQGAALGGSSLALHHIGGRARQNHLGEPGTPPVPGPHLGNSDLAV